MSLWGRWRDPVIADRSLDLMAAVTWLCLAGWGIFASIAGLPTISQGGGQEYTLLWGASIGILGLISGIAALATFLNSSRVAIRIRKKVIELVSVSIMAGFISVYPAFLFIAALGGDVNRIASCFLAVSYLVLPTWRVRHLYLRIRKLREVSDTGTSQ